MVTSNQTFCLTLIINVCVKIKKIMCLVILMQYSIPYTDEDVSNLTDEQPSMNPRQQPQSKGGSVKPPTSGIYCMDNNYPSTFPFLRS